MTRKDRGEGIGQVEASVDGYVQVGISVTVRSGEEGEDGTRRTPDNPKEIKLEIQILTCICLVFWYNYGIILRKAGFIC